MRTSAIHQQGIDETELPCRSEDPELYFAESPSDVELAKALCQDCPVRAECLAGALERREPWGVWGGQLLLNGKVLQSKRRRGRPPKVARPEDQLPDIPIPRNQQIVEFSAVIITDQPRRLLEVGGFEFQPRRGGVAEMLLPTRDQALPELAANRLTPVEPQKTRSGRVLFLRALNTANSTSLGAVLKADTTCALGALAASISAPEPLSPATRWLSSLLIGRVQLSTSLPDKAPVWASTSSTRDQWTASSTASAPRAASVGVPARAFAPAFPASRSSVLGSCE